MEVPSRVWRICLAHRPPGRVPVLSGVSRFRVIREKKSERLVDGTNRRKIESETGEPCCLLLFSCDTQKCDIGHHADRGRHTDGGDELLGQHPSNSIRQADASPPIGGAS